MKRNYFYHMMLLCVFLLMHLIFVPAGNAENFLGTINIKIRDFYTNRPLSGAKVLITPNNYIGSTNIKGEALIKEIVPFRNYQIRAEREGYITRETGFVTVKANEETEVFIPLKKKAVIFGTVKESGRIFSFLRTPLSNAVVVLGKEDSGKFTPLDAQVTNRFGYYFFDNVDEDHYTMLAVKDGYVRSAFANVAASAGTLKFQSFVLQKSLEQTGAPEIVITDSKLNPKPGPYTAPARIFLTATNVEGFKEFYWLKQQQPASAVPLGEEGFFGNVYTFIVPALGKYTVALLAVDDAGTARQASIEFTAENVPPEAVPSVIPGPSELPLIDSAMLFATTSGASAVTAGSTVYLRGFAVDMNLLSPEEFNPDAPVFDVYGNKNGNFKASLFDYEWMLKDTHGNDVSALLTPSITAENVSFQIPLAAQTGETYTATLTVTDDRGAKSQQKSLAITVAQQTDPASCTVCHAEKALGYLATGHASRGGATCQSCHGKGSVHVANNGDPKLSVSYWSGVCGQCHEQFAEIQKAYHSDPLPFGYYEPTDGRITSCYRCHYTQGYIGAIDSGKPFQEFRYTADALPEIPRDAPNISCSVCHDSHRAESDNPYGLRTGSAGHACDTCHYEKWQNAILEGIAGEVGNGYHYSGQDYSPYEGEKNPHRQEDKCVVCHMSAAVADKDAQQVRKVGGHTLRMRDYGDDLIPGTPDDTLNILVCQGCHAGLINFDRNGVQTEVKGLLTELSTLLKGNNHDFLPANQPGKCARCHKGGTVPFLDDPDKILEHAYTNYKLFVNDRSYGIHNPGYTRKLLQDSIVSVQSYQRSKLEKSSEW
jgi:hypothetical protein